MGKLRGMSAWGSVQRSAGGAPLNPKRGQPLRFHSRALRAQPVQPPMSNARTLLPSEHEPQVRRWACPDALASRAWSRVFAAVSPWEWGPYGGGSGMPSATPRCMKVHR